MSNFCLCCHTKQNYPESFGKYIEDDLIILHKSFFICKKCEQFIDEGKYNDINFKKTKDFLELFDTCLIFKNSIKQRLEEITKTALFFNVRFSISANKRYIKDIEEAESYLKKYIPKMNELYKIAMPDFALIGLKKTASEYYSFTGKELVEFLGIKQSSINKFRKLNNITGAGYIYDKKEIEEILALS